MELVPGGRAASVSEWRRNCLTSRERASGGGKKGKGAREPEGSWGEEKEGRTKESAGGGGEKEAEGEPGLQGKTVEDMGGGGEAKVGNGVQIQESHLRSGQESSAIPARPKCGSQGVFNISLAQNAGLF